MATNHLVGAILLVTAVVEAGMAMWLPERVQDERQRTVLRFSLFSSAILIAGLGVAFFFGIFQGAGR